MKHPIIEEGRGTTIYNLFSFQFYLQEASTRFFYELSWNMQITEITCNLPFCNDYANLTKCIHVILLKLR